MAWATGTRPKAPKIRKPTVAPTGPRALGLRRAPAVVPDPLSMDFGIGFDSMSEKLIYYACFVLLGPERPGVWRYQDPVISGIFQVARSDFAVYQGRRRTVMRVQTSFFHYGAGARKQAYDLRQRLALEQFGWRVIDLPEERFVADRTGGAAIALVKRALRGEEVDNPVTAGTSVARPTRVVR